jgi:hypothetical protein
MSLSGIGATNNPASEIVPVRRMAYIDVVQVWLLKTPLSAARLAWLQRRCAFVRPDFGGRRPRLIRPNREALQWLATLKHRLNYAEAALDLIFTNEDQRDAARQFVDQNLVQRWHRDDVRRHRGTRYTTARGRPNNLTVYSDKRSNITREPFCLHLEWRLSGVRALRRAGIGSLNDLLRLDHRTFWSERLLLRAVDLNKLGRLHCVHVLHRGPRRGPWRKHFRGLAVAFDYHAQTGSALWLTRGSVQTLIDEWRVKWRDDFPISRCLDEPMAVDHLLPTEVWPAPPPAADQTTVIIYDSWCQMSRTAPNPLPHNEITQNSVAIPAEPEE